MDSINKLEGGWPHRALLWFFYCETCWSHLRAALLGLDKIQIRHMEVCCWGEGLIMYLFKNIKLVCVHFINYFHISCHLKKKNFMLCAFYFDRVQLLLLPCFTALLLYSLLFFSTVSFLRKNSVEVELHSVSLLSVSPLVTEKQVSKAQRNPDSRFHLCGVNIFKCTPSGKWEQFWALTPDRSGSVLCSSNSSSLGFLVGGKKSQTAWALRHRWGF